MDETVKRDGSGARLPSFTLQSEGLPAHRQRDIWMGLGCLFEPLAAPLQGTIDFRLRGWHLGPLLFNAFEQGFPRLGRTRSSIHADHRDHYVVAYGAGRAARGDAGGRPFAFGPGECVILDMARAVDVHDVVQSGFFMVIPRDALDALVAPGDLHGLVLGRGIGRLVGDHLAALHRNLSDMSTEDVGSVSHASLSLIAAAVSSNADTLAQAASPIDSALLMRAQRHIELNLQRPDLSIEDIRAACTISRARLYRLFRPFGGVMAYLQTRRLARARMAFNAGDAGSIGQMAFRFGFSNEGHFSRLFRREFGESPRDCRRRAPSALVLSAPAAVVSGRHIWSSWLDNLRG